MATQFVFELKNEPGTLAEVASTLGDAGINIEGISASGKEDVAIFQLLTNHTEDAREVLKEAKIPFREEDVLLLKMKNYPGQIAILTHTLADHGINIKGFYVTMKGTQVLSAEPLERAKSVASELKILA